MRYEKPNKPSWRLGRREISSGCRRISHAKRESRTHDQHGEKELKSRAVDDDVPREMKQMDLLEPWKAGDNEHGAEYDAGIPTSERYRIREVHS
jgi:hypothetical protein